MAAFVGASVSAGGLVEAGLVDAQCANELMVPEDDAVDAGDERGDGQPGVFDSDVDLVVVDADVAVSGNGDVAGDGGGVADWIPGRNRSG